MKEHAKEFPIEKMAKIFQVSTSGYYAYLHREPSKREKKNIHLIGLIKEVYEEGRKVYGSPRIHAVLQKRGIPCSRKRVAKLMREHEIAVKMRPRWKKTTKQGKRQAAENIVRQEFTKEKANHTWVSDITYIQTEEGWLYLSVVIDLFSRKVVGVSMGDRIDTCLIERAIRQALCHRSPSQGLIHHSDRGSQYTSEEFAKLAKSHGILLSMSSTGNCYDNAVAESFFHTLKTELVYQEKYVTREEAKRSIFEYIEIFYNRQRVHSFLGYLSPEQFEQNWSKQAI